MANEDCQIAPKASNVEFKHMYEYNGLFYTILETADIHNILQSNPEYFVDYIQKNTVNVKITETSGEDEFRWDTQTVNLLLESYLERLVLFNDPTIKRKKLWTEVQKIFHNNGYEMVTCAELERKIRNLKRRYRVTREDFNTSNVKGKKIKWEFYGMCDKIFGDNANDSISRNSDYINVANKKMDLLLDSSDDNGTFLWSRKAVRLLLKCYQERHALFNNRSYKKYKLWSQILKIFYHHGFKAVTREGLDRKIRNMKKRYQDIRKTLSKGRNTTTWEYYSICDKIFGDNELNLTKRDVSNSEDSVGSEAEARLSYRPKMKQSPYKAPLHKSTSQNSNINKFEPKDSSDEQSDDAHSNFYQSCMRAQQVEVLSEIAASLMENNRIQRERNDLLREIFSNSSDLKNISNIAAEFA